MAKYEVFVTHTFEDSVYVEADSPDEAMDLAEAAIDGIWSVVSTKDNYRMPWDHIEAYEVVEGEE